MILDSNQKQYISLSQAGKQSGYTAEYLRQLCVKGKLAGQKIGKSWIVSRGELDRFIMKAAGETPTMAEISHTSLSSVPLVAKATAVIVLSAVIFPVAAQLTNFDTRMLSWSNQLGSTITVARHQAESALYRKIVAAILGSKSADQSGLIAGEVIDNAKTTNGYPNNTNEGQSRFSDSDKVSDHSDYTSPRVLGISNDEIIASLRAVLSEGLPQDILVQLKGEKGERGEPGPALSSIPNSGSVFGTTAPTAQQGSIGTIGSATYLSGKDITSETLTVTSSADFKNAEITKLDVSGSTTLGSSSSDTLIINASLASSLIPATDNIYSLGSQTRRFEHLYLGPGSLNLVCTASECSTERTYTLSINNDPLSAQQGNFRITNGSSDLLNINPSGNLTFVGTQMTYNNAVTMDLLGGTLSINTTNNRPIITGTGLFTLGGSLNISGSTGITLTGDGAGLTFSGSGNHDIVAASGTLRIGANTIIGNILPLDNTIDIGTPAEPFDKIYAEEVNASTLVGTLTGGNLIAETFTINSDNASDDAENSHLRFHRGSQTPHALLTWDASNKRFDLNQRAIIQNITPGLPTQLLLKQGHTQGTDHYLNILNSSDTSLAHITSTGGAYFAGNVGVGQSVPTSKLDVTTNALGTTQTTSSGLALVNTTAAADGAQQISPAIRWSGFGWKTDATAASQAVDFRAFVTPVQGASAPTGYLGFESSINGGAYSNVLAVTSGGSVGIGTTAPAGSAKLHVTGECVAEGTRIRRRRRNKNGEWEEEEELVENIQPGDEVLSFNDKTGDFEWHAVEATMDKGFQKVYEIITSSGKRIKTTAEHPYFVLRSPQITYGTFEADQSIRVEDLSRPTVIGIALGEKQFSAQLSQKDKKEILKVYQKENKPEVFAHETFAMAVVETFRAADIYPARIIIDAEYKGFERRIKAVIARFLPATEVIVSSIGKKSLAHEAAIKVTRGKKKADFILKPEFAGILKGPGSLRNLRALSPRTGYRRFNRPQGHVFTSYYKQRDLSRASWRKVLSIHRGEYIATAGGFEMVTAILEIGRRQAYDLQIEGVHNFLANSIVAHNTYLAASSGNVGIGTTGPGAKLDISDTAGGATPNFRITSSNADSIGLDFVKSAGTSRTWQQRVAGASNGISGMGDGSFYMYDATAGAARFVINSSGNVGIGTTNPGARLHVNTASGNSEIRTSAPTGSYGVLDLRSGSNSWHIRTNDTGASGIGGNNDLSFGWAGSNSQLVIQSGGNVGIGTTNPQGKLDVRGVGLFGDQTSSIGATTYLQVARSGNPTMAFRQLADGAVGNYPLVIDAYAKDTGGTEQRVAQIAVRQQSTHATQPGARIDFLTAVAGTAPAERMTINDSGNVGIGTTSPATQLEVSSASTDATMFQLKNTAAGGMTYRISSTANGSGAGGGKLDIWDGTASRLTIASGNVGIGTTNPGFRLDVESSAATKAKIGNTLPVYLFDNYPGIGFNLYHGGAGVYRFGKNSSSNYGGLVGVAGDTGRMAFQLSSSVGNADAIATMVEPLSILPSGNVGIGTTGPTQKLEVAGNALIGTAGGTRMVIYGGGGIEEFYSTEATPRWRISRDTSIGGSLGAGITFRNAAIGQPGYDNNILAFATGGVANERMRITSTGNVGIGTTAPGAKLHVMTTDASRGIRVQDSSNLPQIQFANNAGDFKWAISSRGTDSDNLYISASPAGTTGTDAANAAKVTIRQDGNVGIGTTNPQGKLDVRGVGLFGDQTSSIGATTYLQVARSGNPTMAFRQLADGAVGNYPLVIDAYAKDTGGTEQRVAQIAVRQQSTHATQPGARIDFLTAVAGTAPAERMTINDSGNVGIGTTSPATQLEVSSASTDATMFQLKNTAAGGMTYRISSTANGSGAGGGKLDIWDGTASRLTIASGNVGIGTTAPVAKLQSTGAAVAAGPTLGSSAGGSLFLTNTNPLYGLLFGSNGGGPQWIQAQRVDGNVSAYSILLNPAGGNVGIGTTDPGSHKLSVVGTAGLSTGTAWTNTSDARLKTIEEELSGSSLDKLMQLNPVSFRWNELHNQKYGTSSDKLNFGFIAQEVEGIFPSLITTDAEGYKWYNPSGFEAILTAAVQELDSKTSAVYQGSNVGIGDVVAFEIASGSALAKTVKKAASSFDAIGVVSSVIASGSEAISAKVAYTGRMKVKVSEEKGQIRAGDRLTVSSSNPGYAVKMTESGQSIGTALQDSNGGSEGFDTIPAFISIGYQKLEVAGLCTPSLDPSPQGGGKNCDKIVYVTDIDLSGFSLLNVKAIASISGKWSISEDGVLVAREVKTEKLCIGETCVDETTLKQLLIQNGLLTESSPGNGSQTSESQNSEDSSVSDSSSEEGESAEPATEPETSPEPE